MVRMHSSSKHHVSGYFARRVLCLVVCVAAMLLPAWPAAETTLGQTAAGVRLAAGKKHSALVLQDGSLYTWGDNTFGQLGFAGIAYSDQPRQVELAKRVVDISLGADHSLILTEDGTVLAMGAQ